MAILNIVYHPDPVLKLPTQAITTFDNTLTKLAEDMLDTMDHYQGVGLAGPQIGILEKILVVGYERDRFALINPTILTCTGSDVMEEGCLSIPEVAVPVERFTKIKIKAQDLTGQTFERDYDGFLARIIQHEIDHLNGILILDKVHE